MKLQVILAVGLMGATCLAQAAQPLPPVIGSDGGRLSDHKQGRAISVSSQMMLDMYRQTEQLKREVQQLRGELEELTYHMNGVKKRQRDIYLDLDRRLLPLEEGRLEKHQRSGGQQLLLSVTPEPAKRPTAQVKEAKPSSAKSLAAERKAYQNAFNTLKEGHYSASLKQFNAFLVDYPAGEYADNATYWLAETYYVTRAFSEADRAFEKVMVSFPQSSKVPDSLLKRGYIAYELKNWKTARKKLTEVVRKFPNSTVARLAEKRLLRMKQEKH